MNKDTLTANLCRCFALIVEDYQPTMERNRTVSVFDPSHIELSVLRFGFVLVLRFSYERSDRLVVTFNISRFMRSGNEQRFSTFFHLMMQFNMNLALRRRQ
ncbi:hypothetical protein ILYODFUR_038727 [Ilyodon furcidens]|uniref:Uncharacterized protein n=1 Tax=Ilyodon furcidens TaxID=33524 RepID=A0ABV0UPG3_9TELE